ncbi:MAG: GNAT family N-acetyltransferase [Granulosicoccaceae bacterium]
MQFQHHPEQQRYVLQFEDAEAYVSYVDRAGLRVLNHSFVPPEFRGKKVGAELARRTFALLIEEGIEAKATCGYLLALAKRRPEWRRFV